MTRVLWLVALCLCTSPLWSQSFDFTYNDGTKWAGSIDADLYAEGHYIGTYDKTTNTSGTRTKPVSMGVFTSTTENWPVPASTKTHAERTMNTTIIGTFCMTLQPDQGVCRIQRLTTGLPSGRTITVPTSTYATFESAYTRNPTGAFPGQSNYLILEESATVTRFDAVQTEGTAKGTLSAPENGVYTFEVDIPVLATMDIRFQGTTYPGQPAPMLLHVTGTVTPAPDGAGATLTAAYQVASQIDQQVDIPLPSVPLDVPSLLGTYHFLFNLSAKRVVSNMNGTVNLGATGVPAAKLFCGIAERQRTTAGTQRAITVQFWIPGALTPSEQHEVMPESDGYYQLETQLTGMFDVRFGALHHLSVLVPGVTLPHSGLLNVSLINGDADGDNQITLFDYLVLDGAFGTALAQADLDDDGQVTLFDYLVVDSSFGAQGD